MAVWLHFFLTATALTEKRNLQRQKINICRSYWMTQKEPQRLMKNLPLSARGPLDMQQAKLRKRNLQRHEINIQ
jgi:hypothetical protein